MGLCHIQIYWSQSPCPAAVGGWPILPQEALKHSPVSSLWDIWVLVCTRFVWASELLWGVRGLILNMISPLLPSLWSFSFALWSGASCQSHSSARQLPLQHLLSWCFSVIEPWVSSQSCSSAMQPPRQNYAATTKLSRYSCSIGFFIQLVLIFAYIVRQRFLLKFFQVDTLLFQHCLLNSTYFSHWMHASTQLY